MDHIVYQNHHLHIDLYPSFLDPEQATSLFQYLDATVPWPDKIKYGRRVNQNYGDDGLKYTLNFGGYGNKPAKSIERPVLPWNDLPILASIRDVVSQTTQSMYNYCVVQRYPNGSKGINPHRDKEMRPDADIVGLSLGAERTLTMIPCSRKNGEQPASAGGNRAISIQLPPGSLYVLKPPTNEYWMHSIAVDPTITEPRISLTYRFQ